MDHWVADSPVFLGSKPDDACRHLRAGHSCEAFMRGALMRGTLVRGALMRGAHVMLVGCGLRVDFSHSDNYIDLGSM